MKKPWYEYGHVFACEIAGRDGKFTAFIKALDLADAWIKANAAYNNRVADVKHSFNMQDLKW